MEEYHCNACYEVFEVETDEFSDEDVLCPNCGSDDFLKRDSDDDLP